MMAIKLFLTSRILTDLATADYRAVKQNSRTEKICINIEIVHTSPLYLFRAIL